MDTLNKETLIYLFNILAVSFLLLSLIVFYPQYSSAFFHSNQIDSPLGGNLGSSISSLYSNPDSLYGSNFGSMFGGSIGGLGGLGINNGFGMMTPGFGYGYGTPSFSMGGGGSGGFLDVFSGLLGGLGSSPSFNQEGFGSDYNSDYNSDNEYESNYNNNNFDYTIQPNSGDLGSFGGYNSDYGSNSDFDYGNEFQSDLPLEDLRSFDSSMGEQQYSFQEDYDFSQIPIDDFSSSLFQ